MGSIVSACNVVSSIPDHKTNLTNSVGICRRETSNDGSDGDEGMKFVAVSVGVASGEGDCNCSSIETPNGGLCGRGEISIASPPIGTGEEEGNGGVVKTSATFSAFSSFHSRCNLSYHYAESSSRIKIVWESEAGGYGERLVSQHPTFESACHTSGLCGSSGRDLRQDSLLVKNL